ncbi:MAG: hypothetical protein M5U28_14165 [Sandaracinaceae bacterium]|nr:hypothetical protein [Sandaracinaceae bacterium]
MQQLGARAADVRLRPSKGQRVSRPVVARGHGQIDEGTAAYPGCFTEHHRHVSAHDQIRGEYPRRETEYRIGLAARHVESAGEAVVGRALDESGGAKWILLVGGEAVSCRELGEGPAAATILGGIDIAEVHYLATGHTDVDARAPLPGAHHRAGVDDDLGRRVLSASERKIARDAVVEEWEHPLHEVVADEDVGVGLAHELAEPADHRELCSGTLRCVTSGAHRE